MSESEWTKILGWPGYRVYRSEIKEAAKTLRLWVRRQRGNRRLECSGCGRKISDCRGLRAGGTRSAVVRISHDGSDRALSSALSGVRDQSRESSAAAEQGALQIGRASCRERV